MKNSIVKCSNWDTEDQSFCFASYIYLHGEAQNINGYDCCEGNIEFFRLLLRLSPSLTTLLMQDGTTHRAIVFPYGDMSRHVSGLVCLVSDINGIKSALDYQSYYSSLSSLTLYDDDINELKKNAPEAYKSIVNYRKNK